MKRLITGVWMIGMLAMMPAVPEIAQQMPVYAEEEYVSATSGILEYNKYDSYIEITGCTEMPAGELQIPAELENLPVRQIADYAFSGCETLTSVVIPDSVEYIGSCAFISCTGLQNISIPETVTFIGYGAFDETPWRETQTQDSPYLIINHMLLDAAGSSGEVMIPDGIVKIGEFAFSYCEELTSVVIPDSVKEIGEGAFSYCYGLKNVDIPDSVEIIGESAFAECSSLKSVEFSASQVGGYAFGLCTALTEAKIKNPYCEFLENTVFRVSYSTVIYGYTDSTAQAYAEENDFAFVSLGDAPDLLAGDVDGSGKVDILDVITMNKAVLGKESLNKSQIKAADFNQNGVPDSEESLMILKYIVGLIESL